VLDNYKGFTEYLALGHGDDHKEGILGKSARTMGGRPEIRRGAASGWRVLFLLGNLAVKARINRATACSSTGRDAYT
jgi:hypothetical protein